MPTGPGGDVAYGTCRLRGLGGRVAGGARRLTGPGNRASWQPRVPAGAQRLRTGHATRLAPAARRRGVGRVTAGPRRATRWMVARGRARMVLGACATG